MRCKNCKYWEKETKDRGRASCLRYPPIIEHFTNTRGNISSWSVFPDSFKDSWCGEFTRIVKSSNITMELKS